MARYEDGPEFLIKDLEDSISLDNTVKALEVFKNSNISIESIELDKKEFINYIEDLINRKKN